MIIFNDMTYLTRSDLPNEDWTGQAKYVVADGSELANKILEIFPFTPIEDDKGNLIDVEPKNILQMLSKVKELKINELSKICENRIIAGKEVTLLNGEIKKYTLDRDDQANWTIAVMKAIQGYPYKYHANGDFCEWYSSEEILNITNKLEENKIFITTKFNHLKKWVERCNNIIDVSAITFDSQLPEDLQSHMDELMSEPPANMINN